MAAYTFSLHTDAIYKLDIVKKLQYNYNNCNIITVKIVMRRLLV